MENSEYIDKKNEREFLDFVCESYASWLDGTEDDEKINDKIKKNLVEQQNAQRETINNFKNANAQLLSHINNIKENYPDLNKLEAKKQKLINDKQKLIKLNDAMGKHYQGCLKKLKDKKAERVALEEQIHNSDLKLKELNEILKNQKISPEDVKIMKKQSQVLLDRIDEIDLKYNEMKKTVYKRKLKLDNKLKILQESVKKYNALGREIEIIPKTAHFACGNDWELKLNPMIFDNNIDGIKREDMKLINNINEMCNINLDECKEMLNNIKQHFDDALIESEINLKNIKAKYQDTLNALNDKKKSVLNLEKRINVLKKHINEQKVLMNEMQRETIIYVEENELKLNNRKDYNKNVYLNKKKELKDTILKYENTIKNYKENEKKFCAIFKRIIKLITDSRQNIRNKLLNELNELNKKINDIDNYNIKYNTKTNNDTMDID